MVDGRAIADFIDALFRYADAGTFISLRAFDQQDRGRPPLFIEGCRINGDMRRLVAQAESAAARTANAEAPAVFAPPVATFANPHHAGSTDLANGVSVSVDLDHGNPRAALGWNSYSAPAPWLSPRVVSALTQRPERYGRSCTCIGG